MNNPSLAFMRYLQSQGIPVVSVSVLVDPVTDPVNQVVVNLDPSATPAQSQAANQALGSFNFQAPDPAPDKFVASILVDQSLTPILFLLAPYQQAIAQYGANPQIIKTIWSQLVAQYGNGPLTPAMQQTIQNYASQAGMPLK